MEFCGKLTTQTEDTYSACVQVDDKMSVPALSPVYTLFIITKLLT